MPPIEKIMPTILIIMFIISAIIYFCYGDIRHGIYWLAAAVLNAAITF